MRLMVSILAGFFVGFLALGSLIEWLLDLTAGRCDIGCAGWRRVVFVAVTLFAWVFVARLAYLWWGRRWPSEPSTRLGDHFRRLLGLEE